MHQVFRAVAATVVPEAAQLDAAAWAELEQIVERALADRPVAMRPAEKRDGSWEQAAHA